MAADRQVAVGAFVFGGLVLALGAIILFGSFRLFNPMLRAAVVFQGSISGLAVGAPVTFRGVRVGAVESIVLQFDRMARAAFIPVTLSLDGDRVRVTGTSNNADLPGFNLSSLVDRGLRAELVTQSFVTGQSQIDLDFDPNSPATLHPSVTPLPEIPTRLSTIQRVQEQLTQLPLQELVSDGQAALQSLRSLSERMNERFPSLATSLQQALDTSSHTMTTANAAIDDLRNRMAGTLTRLDTTLASGDQLINQRGVELRTLLMTTNDTMLQAKQALTDLKSMTSARGEARVNLDATLRDLAASAASLRGFANDIERNPQLLLTGRRQ